MKEDLKRYDNKVVRLIMDWHYQQRQPRDHVTEVTSQIRSLPFFPTLEQGETLTAVGTGFSASDRSQDDGNGRQHRPSTISQC